MTRATIFVKFDGKVMPLYEAAKLAGLSDYCARKRYQKGERGDVLFRPSHRGRSHKIDTNDQVDALRAKREVKEAAERTKHEQRLARQRRERDSKDRVAAEHAAAFARPLIDAKLLTKAERQAIRERVKYSGQVNWRTNGASF